MSNIVKDDEKWWELLEELFEKVHGANKTYKADISSKLNTESAHRDFVDKMGKLVRTRIKDLDFDVESVVRKFSSSQETSFELQNWLDCVEAGLFPASAECLEYWLNLRLYQDEEATEDKQEASTEAYESSKAGDTKEKSNKTSKMVTRNEKRRIKAAYELPDMEVYGGGFANKVYRAANSSKLNTESAHRDFVDKMGKLVRNSIKDLDFDVESVVHKFKACQETSFLIQDWIDSVEYGLFPASAECLEYWLTINIGQIEPEVE